MERLSDGIKTTTTRRRNHAKSSEAREDRPARTNPRSRALNRSSRANEFLAFAEEIRRDLNPRGPLQRLAADHVVHHAWRLKQGLEKQSGGKIDQAARSMKEALETFHELDDRASIVVARPVIVPFIDSDSLEADTAILPNEWPIVPSDDLPEELETLDDEVPCWRDRLVYDFDVSDLSPVVKGTWITVSHVVTLIIDGWTWADILRAHPELTEDDIRTCVAYAVDEENTVS